MGLEALIFDADGTLAETDELHRAAYNAAFKSHDLDWTFPSAATTADVIRSYVAQYRNTDTGRRLLEALLDDLVAAKDAKYSRLIENGGAMLRPGVARLLREARNARVPIGITTLLNRNDFEFMLQNHLGVGAASICSVITCGEDLGQNPTIATAFQTTLAALGTSPNRTVAITATPTGAAAGSACGLRVVATPGLYTSSERFPGAGLILSDLGHPAAPFQVIDGDAVGHNFASLEALRSWIDKDQLLAA